MYMHRMAVIMSQISSRVKSVSGSPTVRLAGIIANMKAKGQNIVSFAVGEPDFPTPNHIVEAAKKALDEGFTKYTSSFGIPELREAVADKSVKENKIPAKPENVLIAPAKYCIFMAVMSLVENGDEVIIPDPCWISYEPIVRLAGGKPVLVQATEDTNFELSPDNVADAITNKTRMMIINTPSNPGGSVFSIDTIKGLTDLTKDHDLYMVSDEIYDKLIYDGEHYSPASFDRMFERTVTVNGFSKTYSMTGWRVGWLITSKDLVNEISKIQEHSITCVTAFVQKAALAALKGPDSSIKSMVKEFRTRRDMMMTGLKRLDIFELQVPQGAFYLFPSYSLNMDSNTLAERFLNDANVAVTPGIAFGPSGERHVRFSYATSREEIEKGLQNIESALEKIGKG